MRSAGCAANDVADREFDRHVKRTAKRPVTSGAVSVAEALTLGAALALVAFALVLTTNLAAVAWSVVALAVTLVYPFSKRFFAMPQARPRHRLQLRHPDGVRRGARRRCLVDRFDRRRGAGAGVVAALRQPVLGARLRHRVRHGRSRRRPAHRHQDLGDHARPLRRRRGDGCSMPLSWRLWAAVGVALGYGWPYFAGLARRRCDRCLALHLDPDAHAAKGAFAPSASTTGSASRSSPESSRSSRCADDGDGRQRRDTARCRQRRARATRVRGGRRPQARPRPSERKVSASAPTARSRCSLSTTSGGAKRTTVPCVSLLRTPRASSAFADGARARERRIDLDADQQALAAHLDDRGVIDRAQLGEQLVAPNARALGETLANEQVERGLADRGRERIAAERAAVVAGRELRHHLFARAERAHRQQAAAERLAEDEAVGADAVVVAREHARRCGRGRSAPRRRSAGCRGACRSRARAPGSRRAER